MAMSRIYTVAFQGIEAREVDVQVRISRGNCTFTIVGLADKAVGESRERMWAALSAIGRAQPPQRITVNLAPADLPKEGSHYDLPITLAILAAMGVLPAREMAGYVALGELSLDASLTPVAGVLPAAIAASEAGRGLICPAASGAEAAWAGNIEIIAAPSLIALVNHIKGAQVLRAPVPRIVEDAGTVADLKDVTRPLTTREVTLALMRTRCLNVADAKLVRVMQQRTVACLGHWKRRGYLKAQPAQDLKGLLLWEVAEQPQRRQTDPTSRPT
jgi:magnesium chelatase family protein